MATMESVTNNDYILTTNWSNFKNFTPKEQPTNIFVEATYYMMYKIGKYRCLLNFIR